MNKYLEIVKNHPNKVRFLISRVLWRSNLCRLLTISRKGYKLRFFPTSISAEFWIDPSSRTDDDDFLTSVLQSGDIVVDVGANIGSLALKSALIVGESGVVYAIEPHPRIVEFLRRNIKLNALTNIRVHNVAIGETKGEINFSSTRSDDQNRILPGGQLSVAVLPLDDIIGGHDRIHLLKVDVEGYELSVFRGSEAILPRVDCVFFESFDDHFRQYGTRTSEVTGFLRSSGFSIFRKTLGNEISEVGDHHRSSKIENLIGVRDVKAFIDRTGFKLRLPSG